MRPSRRQLPASTPTWPTPTAPATSTCRATGRSRARTATGRSRCRPSRSPSIEQATEFFVDNIGDGEFLDVELGSLPASSLVTVRDGLLAVTVFEATIPFSVGFNADEVTPEAAVAAAEAVLRGPSRTAAVRRCRAKRPDPDARGPLTGRSPKRLAHRPSMRTDASVLTNLHDDPASHGVVAGSRRLRPATSMSSAAPMRSGASVGLAARPVRLPGGLSSRSAARGALGSPGVLGGWRSRRRWGYRKAGIGSDAGQITGFQPY